MLKINILEFIMRVYLKSYSYCQNFIPKAKVFGKYIAHSLIEKIKIIWSLFLSFFNSSVKNNIELSKEANDILEAEKEFNERVLSVLDFSQVPRLGYLELFFRIKANNEPINAQLKNIDAAIPLFELEKYGKVITYDDAVKLLGMDNVIAFQEEPNDPPVETPYALVFKSTYILKDFIYFLLIINSKGSKSFLASHQYTSKICSNLDKTIFIDFFYEASVMDRVTATFPVVDDIKPCHRYILFEKKFAKDLLGLFAYRYGKNGKKDSFQFLSEMEKIIQKECELPRTITGIITSFICL